jgi:hypothetical protein
MIRKQTRTPFATLSVVLLAGLSFSSSLISPAQAGVTSTQSAPIQISDTFNPPDRGAPPSTADAGTRGCWENYQKGQKGLAALTPPKHLALTVKDFPTLFWYVPASSAANLEFTLLDETDQNILYKTNVPSPSEAGIVSFTLPAGVAPALETGKMYHWYFVMVCNPEDPSANIFVDGWIERTDLEANLAEQLRNAPAEQLPTLYAKAGIWQEAVASLAELLRNDPQNPALRERWKELLKTGGLVEDLADKPLVSETALNN